jgi:hypothetical protein
LPVPAAAQARSNVSAVCCRETLRQRIFACRHKALRCQKHHTSRMGGQMPSYALVRASAATSWGS